MPVYTNILQTVYIYRVDHHLFDRAAATGRFCQRCVTSVSRVGNSRWRQLQKYHSGL